MADSCEMDKAQRLLVPSSTAILAVAQKLRDERLSAVVVSDDVDGRTVSGIVTERDICKSVVSSSQFNLSTLSGGAGVEALTAGHVMTSDPICAKQSCPPEKVISIMLNRNFRHLPVVNNDMALVNLVDILTIAKVLAGQQRAAQQQHKDWFSKALSMFSSFVQTTFFSKRSILTMLDQDGGLKHQLGRKLRCCLSMNCTVAKAVKHMQMLRCSALLVENDESRLVGILTERDIVTKIVAAGLDASTCTIGRIMTPRPTTITINSCIDDALQIILSRGFRHLPVTNSSGQCIGILDVLQLTHGAFRDLVRPDEEESSDVTTARSSIFKSFASALDLKQEEGDHSSDIVSARDSSGAASDTVSHPVEGRPEAVAQESPVEDSKAIETARKGDGFLMERKFDEAVEAYNEALAFDDTPAPVRARILLHRASALMLLDAWTKAEKDFRSVLEIAEAGIKAGQAAATRAADEAHNGLMEVFCANHRYEDAVEQVQLVTQGSQQRAEGFSHLDELSLSLKNKGGECYKAKDWMGAVTMYSYGLRLVPLLRDLAAKDDTLSCLSCPEEHVLLGNRAACYMQMRDFSMALDDCHKSVELDRTYIKTWHRMLSCYKSLGKWANCRAAAEQVLTVSPTDSVAKSMIQEAAAVISPAAANGTAATSENIEPAHSPNVARSDSPALKTTPGGEEGSVSDQLKALAAMMGKTGISE